MTDPEATTRPSSLAIRDGAGAVKPGPILLASQPAPVSRGAATSSNRRENASAHKPDGSSSANALTDRITNDDETAAGECPGSVNSTAYTGYRRTRSSRNA
ncbi:hypothetical protein GCM10010402_75880 [Actinomadura luteofluorescens]